MPIATILGDGSTSSSARQFFRSAKRGDAAGEVNACYGHNPGQGFYTHVSDQHGPYSARVMAATRHEAPYVLYRLMHHGTALRIGTHEPTPAARPMGGIRQDGGKQDVFVIAPLAGAQIGEGAREAGRTVHLVQQLGDPDPR